ncbi:HRAS-like suppressor 3 [Varroa jacobsoni]|uniref:LRAT domain-containing protein n=1 Tax=Varroa destructor TaxID=109461 RepID=A0A7M7MD63_VARDE|nr:HRAS-like suppressor 3 [Varroa destructor]XP_022701603.1 HRAS-like suppressor 3 [Varroa jacobsoni]
MPQSNATTFGLGAFVPAADLVPELKVGDIVEIDRTLYAHWAVHVGDGRVVHVAGPSEEDIPSEPWALVHLCPLAELAGCSRVRVNNKSVRAKERKVRSLDGTQVAARALAQRGHKLDFNFLTRNAEFYATQWKYGQGWSDQGAVALSVMKPLGADLEVGHNTLLTGLQAVFGSPILSYMRHNLPPRSPRTPQKRPPQANSLTAA